MSSFHDWMFRFGFPGFAETEWVLPSGVDHEESWYEPLPWNMACQDLGGWSLDPALAPKLRELHEATFGEALVEPTGVPFHALMAPLRGAFEQGLIVAWVLRVNTVEQPAQLPSAKPQPRPEDKKKTWIEIVLVDENGVPIPNEPYRLTLVSGEKRNGNLDERGFARVDGIEAGMCDVTFPQIDGREWRRA